jgi:hypothetical protein
LYSEETCVAIWRSIWRASPVGLNVDHAGACLASGRARITTSAPTPATATMMRSMYAKLKRV